MTTEKLNKNIKDNSKLASADQPQQSKPEANDSTTRFVTQKQGLFIFLLIISINFIVLFGIENNFFNFKTTNSKNDMAAIVQLWEEFSTLSAHVKNLTTQIDKISIDYPAKIVSAERLQSLETKIINENEAKISQFANNLSTRIHAIEAMQLKKRLAQIKTELINLDKEIKSLHSITDDISIAHAAYKASDDYESHKQPEVTELTTIINTVQNKLNNLVQNQKGIEQNINNVITTSQQQNSNINDEIVNINNVVKQHIQSMRQARAFDAIKISFNNNRDFTHALAMLKNENITIPKALESAAETGIVSLSYLQNSFPNAAQLSIKAANINVENESLMAQFIAWLKSQISMRSLQPKEGSDTDAILSRAQYQLNSGNLSAALNETNQLLHEAQIAMNEWITAAKSRQSAVNALKILQDQIERLP